MKPLIETIKKQSYNSNLVLFKNLKYFSCYSSFCSSLKLIIFIKNTIKNNIIFEIYSK